MSEEKAESLKFKQSFLRKINQKINKNRKMNFWVFIIGFLILYAAGGRKIAIPYGVAFTNWVFVAILTLILDFLQIILFYYIYSKTFEIGILKKFSARIREELGKSKTLAWAKNLGKLGVLTLSMLPSFGGGIWSAVLLAFMLRIDKKIAWLLIITGSLIGISIFAILSNGAIHYFMSLIR